MTIKDYSLIFILAFLIIGCRGTGDTNVESSSDKSGPTTAFQPPPAIPSEILIDLYENCDYIDFIFPNLPFSISQEDKASIQQTMRHINNVAPENYNPSCPYFAQQIFQENGEIVLDAKIFFSQGCTFYLFYENGEAKYSASFTNEGITFYNQILAQAQQTSNNG